MTMLLKTYCSISELTYEIKKSLEYNGICEVMRMYSGIFKDGDVRKKVVFLKIKWLGNQASVSFEASLIHNWGAKVYKLDKWYQPIVSAVDEYGNPIQYQKWIVEPAKYHHITESQHSIEGEFTVWSHPEHEDDPDEDEVEPEQQPDASIDGDDNIIITEEELPMPKLKRCNAVIPGEELSLDFPEVNEPKSDAENDAEIKKLFYVQAGVSTQDKARIAVRFMACNYDLEDLKHLVEHTPFYHEIEKIRTQLAEMAADIAAM